MNTTEQPSWLVIDTAPECFTCQMDAKRAAGGTLTEQERNHWMMRGCTCTPEGSAEANEWMDRVTR